MQVVANTLRGFSWAAGSSSRSRSRSALCRRPDRLFGREASATDQHPRLSAFTCPRARTPTAACTARHLKPTVSSKHLPKVVLLDICPTHPLALTCSTQRPTRPAALRGFRIHRLRACEWIVVPDRFVPSSHRHWHIRVLPRLGLIRFGPQCRLRVHVSITLLVPCRPEAGAHMRPKSASERSELAGHCVRRGPKAKPQHGAR